MSEDYVCFVKKKQLDDCWKREEGGGEGGREGGGVGGGEGEVMLLKDVLEFSTKEKRLLIRGKGCKVGKKKKKKKKKKLSVA